MPAVSATRTLLATVSGNAFLLVGSLFFGLLASILGWIPPRGNLMFQCARWWSRGLLFMSGVKAERLGATLDPAGRYIFMANHRSLFDIPVLIATLPGQVRFLAKESLFRVPIFGWALSAGGFIPIDRRDRSRAKDAFATAVGRLQAGSSILLFPEETRARDEKLLPFQRGGFLLALKSGLPIVPVGIRGTLEVQPRGSFAVRPGRVEVRYGEPLPIADFAVRRKNELIDEVRGRVAELAQATL
jgi:1-acyl-sn-glycerol-3-phosphate acyltransferase